MNLKSVSKMGRIGGQRVLNLEGLENRCLLACDIILSGQTAIIEGSDGADQATVITSGENTKITLSCPGQTVKLTANITSVVFNGGDGDDKFVNRTALPSEAHGGAGNDKLQGGSGNDMLFGDDGDDTIYGNYGNDLIRGGAGNDTLHGGVGSDQVYGDDGDDALFGNSGNDVLRGGTGADRIYGGGGDDILDANDDSIGAKSDQAKDVLFGEAGADTFIVYSDDFGSNMDKPKDLSAEDLLLVVDDGLEE